MIVKMIQNLGNRMEKMQVMLTKGLEETKNRWTMHSVQFSCSIMSNSVTPRTAASQSYLSITKSQSLLKLISIESVIKSNHLILYCPVPFFSCLQAVPKSESFPVSQFFNQVAKALELQLQHQSFQWILRTDFLSDWLDGYEFEQAPELVMDREAWWAAVHGVAKTWTWPRDWTEVICEGDCQQWVISFRGFPDGLVCEESACNAGELPAMQRKQVWSWVRNIPLRRDGNPLQHSCPGSLMDRGATFSSSYILCKNPLNERDEHRNISVEMKG